ncbi:MAG: ABC transporter ATP-binding protein [Bacillota bacterium]|nr:ABC transporter ATP-binding protein [Bacillota bacterium]
MKDYTRSPLKIFIAYIKDEKRLFAIDMLCAVAVAVIDLVFPYVSKNAMQTYLPQSLYKTFFIVMAILVAAYLLKSVMYYIITVVGHKMGVRIEANMREDLFRHVQKLSFKYFDENRTGTTMSRLTSDLFEITELAHHGPENILICTLTIVGAIILMFTIKWELALVLLIILPLCIWFTLSQRLKMRDANIEVKKKTGVIFSAIETSVGGVRTAKAFANEKVELARFNEANDQYRTAKTDYYSAMGLFQSGMEFTLSIMPVAVIAMGGFLIMKGQMDYIVLVTFTLYVSTFVTPVRKLAMFVEQYMQGSAGLSRFLELMRTEPLIKDRENALELENARGEIEFKNVSFSYDKVPVLKNINLSVKPGRCLALVGPSGGGKTTLCQLLMRFYELDEGAITVDGHDVRDLTQESLHRSIGMIQQDVYMFAGTIRDNIRYGRPDATDEEIIEAAKRAEIHNEIMAMPDGYDSYIGERGVMLSGGQKQRLSIARIFLKNPPILILDEATSALDTVTEQRIQASLDRLSEGRTSIIIAHRLSTIRNADYIAVIEHGEIAERGSHEELIAKNGLYERLYNAQKNER